MMDKIISVFVATVILASSVWAELPNYYPKDGFQRVGTLDAVQLERQLIVINDVPYTLTTNTIVHSTSSYRVPLSRLSAGLTIGYKFSSGGRLITEIWLLPSGYKEPRKR